MQDLTTGSALLDKHRPLSVPLHFDAKSLLLRQEHVQRRKICVEIGRQAIRSMHAELTLHPKPGLVSPIDNGSHHDMTASTFMRSLFSLRHYFVSIASAGMDNARFPVLKQLGVIAERRMLTATAGVNTHRGAIFALGLLCAAIGRCHAQHIILSVQSIRAVLLVEWGDALMVHTLPSATGSHGQQVAARHAASGAREEAALGLPSVFDIALPALQRTLDAGRSWEAARVDALFALMAHVSDTNVYYRGGPEGAECVKRHARQFIAVGGTANSEWKAHAMACHRIFVEQRLSPGGAADLLAAACLIHGVLQRPASPLMGDEKRK